MRRCLQCQISIERRHFNAKFCKKCSVIVRRNPLPKDVTKKEVNEIRRLSKKYYKHEIAEIMGVSWSRIGRIKSHYGIKENKRDYPKDLVKKVCEYYARHGRPGTERKFKGVKIRSIVERYLKDFDVPVRQKRFTEKDIIFLSRMQGIVPYSLQAKVLNRPRAGAGSIKAFWQKRMGSESHRLNGLPNIVAKHYLCKPHLDPKRLGLKVKALNRGYETKESRRIILWVDLEKNLRPETPEHLKQAIKAMARFQTWLHGVKNVRLRVKRLMSASTPEELSKLLRV